MLSWMLHAKLMRYLMELMKFNDNATTSNGDIDDDDTLLPQQCYFHTKLKRQKIILYTFFSVGHIKRTNDKERIMNTCIIMP